jgi:hypothetical protein
MNRFPARHPDFPEKAITVDHAMWNVKINLGSQAFQSQYKSAVAVVPSTS